MKAAKEAAAKEMEQAKQPNTERKEVGYALHGDSQEIP